MRTCRFSGKYFDYDKRMELTYNCPEKDEQLILDSGLCIFHDSHFLDNEKNHEIIQKQFRKKIEEYLKKMRMTNHFFASAIVFLD